MLNAQTVATNAMRMGAHDAVIYLLSMEKAAVSTILAIKGLKGKPAGNARLL